MRLALLGCAVGAALLGCTPGGATEPTPTPTPPASSATPPESEMERRQRLDFEAAEKAYRDFQDSFHEAMRNGGSLKPTAVMKETGSGGYLQNFSEVLEGAKRSGFHETGRAVTPFIARTAHYENQVQLTICDDTSAIRVLNSSGKLIGPGDIRLVTAYVISTNDGWKVNSSTGKKVNECDGSLFGL